MELWLEIASYLPEGDLVSLSYTCRVLRTTALGLLFANIQIRMGAQTSFSSANITGMQHILPIIRHLEFLAVPRDKTKKSIFNIDVFAGIVLSYNAFRYARSLSKMTGMHTMGLRNFIVMMPIQERLFAHPPLRTLVLTNTKLVPGPLQLDSTPGITCLRVSSNSSLHQDFITVIQPHLVQLEINHVPEQCLSMLFRAVFPSLKFFSFYSKSFHHLEEEFLLFVHNSCGVLERLVLYVEALSGGREVLHYPQTSLPLLRELATHFNQLTNMFVTRPSIQELRVFGPWSEGTAFPDTPLLFDLPQNSQLTQATFFTQTTLTKFRDLSRPLLLHLVDLYIYIVVCAHQKKDGVSHSGTHDRGCICSVRVETALQGLPRMKKFGLGHGPFHEAHAKVGMWKDWTDQTLTPYCPDLTRVAFAEQNAYSLHGNAEESRVYLMLSRRTKEDKWVEEKFSS